MAPVHIMCLCSLTVSLMIAALDPLSSNYKI